MKILVDENIPRLTTDRLRGLGHDVRDIRGTGDQGLADSELWQIAIQEGRLLITTDKGFTAFRTVSHHGILVVRLRQPNRVKIDQSVMHAIERIRDIDWPGLLVVMRDTTMSTSRAGGPVEKCEAE
jgi:predicted nuclease of predicted toxin-antitoxin system